MGVDVTGSSRRDEFGQFRPIIDTATIERAIAILRRGFPEREASFWTGGFAKIERLRARQGQYGGPLGYLLSGRDGDGGVLLTMRSSRLKIQGSIEVCNLSSWYVDPPHRALAPLMLRKLLKGEEGNLVTDLTPSESVGALNLKLGFSTWSDGVIFASAIPWATLPASRDGTIRPYDDQTRLLLREDEREMMDAHLDLDCLGAVLLSDAGATPVILRVIRRRGWRIGHVIFAECRRKVLSALPCLTRLLLRRGITAAAIDGTTDLSPRGAHFRAGQLRFFKGEVNPGKIDYAYSELVLLGV